MACAGVGIRRYQRVRIVVHVSPCGVPCRSIVNGVVVVECSKRYCIAAVIYKKHPRACRCTEGNENGHNGLTKCRVTSFVPMPNDDLLTSRGRYFLRIFLLSKHLVD